MCIVSVPTQKKPWVFPRAIHASFLPSSPHAEHTDLNHWKHWKDLHIWVKKTNMPYVHLEQDHNNRLIHLSIFRELLAKMCKLAPKYGNESK